MMLNSAGIYQSTEETFRNAEKLDACRVHWKFFFLQILKVSEVGYLTVDTISGLVHQVLSLFIYF